MASKKWEFCSVTTSRSPGIIFDSHKAYCKLYASKNSIEININVYEYIANLGKEGWELVNVSNTAKINQYETTEWFFKREITE